MSGRGLFQRMRGWFGGKAAPAESPSTVSKRYSLGPVDSSAAIAMVGSGAAATGISAPRMPETIEGALSPETEVSPSVLVDEQQANAEVEEPGSSALPTSPVAGSSRLDPLDPVWMRSMDELPARMAESALKAAAGLRCLENIGAELEGHRQNARAMTEALKRLPEIAGQQTDLSRQMNRTLERQALVLESSLDALSELRAAFKGVEETSRRQVMAISQLEQGHREILHEYQDILVRSNRRLARLAMIAVVLGVAALVGVAIALFHTAAAGQ
jgi:hypothetical protein